MTTCQKLDIAHFDVPDLNWRVWAASNSKGVSRVRIQAFRRLSSARLEHGMELLLRDGDLEVNVQDGAAVLDDFFAELGRYFRGLLRTFRTPVDLSIGTAFQRRVWAELQRIPYGETIAYGELARRLGKTGAARAVGNANGRNPVPIVVPCHRVIAGDGGLGGFTGGLQLKQGLLKIERGDV